MRAMPLPAKVEQRVGDMIRVCCIGYPLLRIRMDGVPMRLVKEIVPKREIYVGRVLKGVKLSNRISKSWQRVG